MNNRGHNRPKSENGLWNRELLLIFLITFIAYSNISVFFEFYEYLRTLPIDPKWFGLIIAIFSGASLLFRPVISAFIHARNVRLYLNLGTVFVILTLASYKMVSGLGGILIVRTLHGIAFVILGTALMVLTVDYIPKGRSAQAFGLLSIIILIPNTIIPPILPLMDKVSGGFTNTLLGFSFITLLVIFMLRWIHTPETEQKPDSINRSILSWEEILNDLKELRIMALLLSMLLFYSTHAIVFFFLDGYGRSIGIPATGLFMSLATGGEIAIRLGAGSLFDRMNKPLLASFTMIMIAISYLLLAHVRGKISFYGMGLALGLGWGIAMPVFNGLMFDISSYRFRAFNMNLGLQMFQGGFFLGPFIGGVIVTKMGFNSLFYFCSIMAILSAFLVFYLKGKER